MNKKLKLIAISSCVLTAVAISNSLLLSVANAKVPTPTTNTIAGNSTAFPLKEILPKIKNKTQIPIYLPSQLPFSDKVFFKPNAKANSYSVEFNYTPDCGGTACYIGAIEAEKGGQFTKPMGIANETFKNIQLANKTKAVFFNGCGAYCTALVEWQTGGVLYRVTMKNGREETLKQIANSAIQAGRR